MTSTCSSSLPMSSNSSTQRKPPSPVEVVVGNNDLITEILLRLPAKSVLKFKLVSKKWFSIISEPSFAIRHTHLNPHTISALILKVSFFFKQPPRYKYLSFDGKSLTHLPYDFLAFDPDQPGILYVSQSCNGLFLCSKRRWYSGESSKPTYYVLNPATRQSAMLPLPPCHGINYYRLQLVFDPSKSPNYQVICIRFFKSELEIHVYSSETKDWKLCTCQKNFDSLSVNFENGVILYGAIHWISPIGNGFSLFPDEGCLRKLPRPPLPESWGNDNFRYFGESGGELQFIGFLAGNQNPDDLNMGILSSDSSSTIANIFPDQTLVVYAKERDCCSKWFAKYCLRMSPIVMANPMIIEDPMGLPFSVNRSVHVLSFVEGNKEEGPLLVLNILGEITYYSFKDGTFRKILSFLPFRHATCYAFNYIETLSRV